MPSNAVLIGPGVGDGVGLGEGEGLDETETDGQGLGETDAAGVPDAFSPPSPDGARANHATPATTSARIAATDQNGTAVPAA
jgi:hypothetical protein